MKQIDADQSSSKTVHMIAEGLLHIHIILCSAASAKRCQNQRIQWQRHAASSNLVANRRLERVLVLLGPLLDGNWLRHFRASAV